MCRIGREGGKFRSKLIFRIIKVMVVVEGLFISCLFSETKTTKWNIFFFAKKKEFNMLLCVILQCRNSIFQYVLVKSVCVHVCLNKPWETIERSGE